MPSATMDDRTIVVDENIRLLVRDGEILVECGLSPRLRSIDDARRVREAVRALLAAGLSLRRTRSHDWTPSGREHCLACGDEGPRRILCQVCGCCRSCCHDGEGEAHWWQSEDLATREELSRRAQRDAKDREDEERWLAAIGGPEDALPPEEREAVALAFAVANHPQAPAGDAPQALSRRWLESHGLPQPRRMPVLRHDVKQIRCGTSRRDMVDARFRALAAACRRSLEWDPYSW